MKLALQSAAAAERYALSRVLAAFPSSLTAKLSSSRVVVLNFYKVVLQYIEDGHNSSRHLETSILKTLLDMFHAIFLVGRQQVKGTMHYLSRQRKQISCQFSSWQRSWRKL